MKKKMKIGMGGIGAISLVLVVVVLSMSVMGMLTLTNARSDERFSRRSAQVTERVYRLYDSAERMFAQLDGIAAECLKNTDTDEAYLAAVAAQLPSECSMDGATVSWQTTEDTHTIWCEVFLQDRTDAARLTWTGCRISANTEDVAQWN